MISGDDCVNSMGILLEKVFNFGGLDSVQFFFWKNYFIYQLVEGLMLYCEIGEGSNLRWQNDHNLSNLAHEILSTKNLMKRNT